MNQYHHLNETKTSKNYWGTLDRKQKSQERYNDFKRR